MVVVAMLQIPVAVVDKSCHGPRGILVFQMSRVQQFVRDGETKRSNEQSCAQDYSHNARRVVIV